MSIKDTLSQESDCVRLLNLLGEIGEEYREPFIDSHDIIVVRMDSTFAFLFDLQGKRVD